MTDQLHEHDAALIRAVSHSLNDNSRWLIAPNVDMKLEWFKSDLGQRFFKALMSLLMQNRKLDFISLLTLVCKDRSEAELLRTLFKEGRASESVDLNSLVGVLKTDYMVRMAQSAINKYFDQIKADPAGVQRYVDILNSSLAAISRGNTVYDARPSAHYEDKDLHLDGTWGSEGLDAICDGGRLAFGFYVGSAPSGMGKTTLGRTLAIHSIIQGYRVVIMSNEMPASHYSKTIRDALFYLYGCETEREERSKTDVLADIDRCMAVYENVTDFDAVARYLYWEQPQLSILDSVTAVGAPGFASRFEEDGQHKAKADTLLQYTRQFDTFLYAPGNMSQTLQAQLIKKPHSVQQAMLFGSIAYHNASDGALLSWRDPVKVGEQNFRIVKNRRTGRIGYEVKMQFNAQMQAYVSEATDRSAPPAQGQSIDQQHMFEVDEFPVYAE